ncbi:MAG: DUF305 domain-containing protein [Actinomycetes bacterium]
MQFNISKKNLALGAVIGLIAFAFGFLLSNRGEVSDMMMSGMHNSSTSNSEFSAADLHFAQMMIPHHQQAIEMSKIAFKNSKDPDVIELAKQIKDAQSPEIIQMKSWLTKSGLDADAPHNMMMSGMLSEAEMSELKKSNGTSFDKLFLAGMIKHHEGALLMVQMVDESKNSEVKTLAENILTSQRIEIETMKAMLTGK